MLRFPQAISIAIQKFWQDLIQNCFCELQCIIGYVNKKTATF